jgi:hypothetical protein
MTRRMRPWLARRTVRLAYPAAQIRRHNVGLAVVGEVGVLSLEKRLLATRRRTGSMHTRLFVSTGATARHVLDAASGRLVVEKSRGRELHFRGLVVEASLAARPRSTLRGLARRLSLGRHLHEGIDFGRARGSVPHRPGRGIGRRALRGPGRNEGRLWRGGARRWARWGAQRGGSRRRHPRGRIRSLRHSAGRTGQFDLL